MMLRFCSPLRFLQSSLGSCQSICNSSLTVHWSEVSFTLAMLMMSTEMLTGAGLLFSGTGGRLGMY